VQRSNGSVLRNLRFFLRDSWFYSDFCSLILQPSFAALVVKAKQAGILIAARGLGRQYRRLAHGRAAAGSGRGCGGIRRARHASPPERAGNAWLAGHRPGGGATVQCGNCGHNPGVVRPRCPRDVQHRWRSVQPRGPRCAPPLKLRLLSCAVASPAPRWESASCVTVGQPVRSGRFKASPLHAVSRGGAVQLFLKNPEVVITRGDPAKVVQGPPYADWSSARRACPREGGGSSVHGAAI
jgi:hypothetical protein